MPAVNNKLHNLLVYIGVRPDHQLVIRNSFHTKMDLVPAGLLDAAISAGLVVLHELENRMLGYADLLVRGAAIAQQLDTVTDVMSLFE